MSRRGSRRRRGVPLSERERAILDERVAAAEAWLETYAPDSARIAVRRDAIPEAAADLDDPQRRFLSSLADAGERAGPVGGDAWQALVFDVARSDDLPPRRAFEAIYLAFLGRPNGPRAGWLLASLDPAFVAERAREAAGGATVGGPR